MKYLLRLSCLTTLHCDYWFSKDKTETPPLVISLFLQLSAYADRDQNGSESGTPQARHPIYIMRNLHSCLVLILSLLTPCVLSIPSITAPVAHCDTCPTTTNPLAAGYIAYTTVITTVYTTPYGSTCTTTMTTTVTTTPQSQQTQTFTSAAVGYCSTLYETGPGLPTTRQGGCGTILVENPPASLARGSLVSDLRMWGSLWFSVFGGGLAILLLLLV